MEDNKMLEYLRNVLQSLPNDWLRLTTHRLDIYEEKLAKTQFLEKFEAFYEQNISDQSVLNELPTAFDYIRLGHPLSCILEWAIAHVHQTKAQNVISFSSRTAPIMAVLRKNLLNNKNTLIAYEGNITDVFDAELIKRVYGYKFELKNVTSIDEEDDFDGSVVFVSEKRDVCTYHLSSNVDFYINSNKELGSIILVNKEENESYVSEIQHVRRRETIAMTPANCMAALRFLVDKSPYEFESDVDLNKFKAVEEIKRINGSYTKAIIGSSGLSIQYAIMMGLIHDALDNHIGQDIKFIVPPNCYGGTNDQARRVAACLDNVEIMDLPVDGGNDMVNSIDTVLNKIADQNAVPYIIAEIPTNPRVEVPNLEKLRDVLSKERKTLSGEIATAPVFVLDQTFCPNVQFLVDDSVLSSVKTISYVSGSKFPSGGLCTAGYAIANKKANHLMDKIEKHLLLCDNEATDLQYEILAIQLPSMVQRIHEAYVNTRDFVNFIQEELPSAKINFVSEELAEKGFTPSVFSIDLPTKGDTEEERESYKRELNLKLINSMINEIPQESKFCVSYGQLKGCYWTIPATSTQGTTKEGDKDYIVRVALSSQMDLERHKKIFTDFVEKEIKGEQVHS